MINSIKQKSPITFKWLCIAFRIIITLIVLLTLTFSIFDLIDKFNLVSTSQLNTKIALVALSAIALAVYVILWMLELAQKSIPYATSAFLLVFTILLWLGYANVLLPKLDGYLEKNFFVLKNVLLGFAIPVNLFLISSLVFDFQQLKNC